MRYDFFHTLERSKATTIETGWQVSHLVISAHTDSETNDIAAVMPLYIKHHSYGEYMFDWSWAKAYQEHGLAYYPKIVSAVPFTPITGERLAISADFLPHRKKISAYVSELLINLGDKVSAQTLQLLFTKPEAKLSFSENGWLARTDLQYHWHNQNYLSFTDFLDTLKSRKRKNILNERRKVEAAGITINRYTGNEISDSLWEKFFTFYQMTYLKRSGSLGYLSLEFFQMLGRAMKDNTLLVLASFNNEVIAGALYLFDEHTLYGRYWGCNAEFEFLHFELCYYQGIEWCIANNLQTFNAGAQGEHKVTRGFTPIKTHGVYRVKHPMFSDAIGDFLEREEQLINQQQQDLMAHLPYKAK